MPPDGPPPPPATNWLVRVHDGIGHTEELVAIGLVATMGIVINLQVFFRYLVGRPFMWSEEVARLLLVWLTFIAAPATIRRGGDMAVDTFIDMLPLAVRRKVHVWRDALMILVYGLVAWEAYRLVRAVEGMPLVATEWPTALLAWPLVVGCLLIVLHVLVRLWQTVLVIRHGNAGGQPAKPS